MTPFDPAALLAVLVAFYPIVLPAELARARRERPEYFAGGRLIGRHGDKLELPDGSVWDLIFDVDGFPGRQRWQVIRAGGDPSAPPDELALEPGPLTPFDELVWPAPAPRDQFAALVGDGLEELGAAGAIVLQAEGGASEVIHPAALEAALERELEPALAALVDARTLLEQATPGDVLEATRSRGSVIDAGEGAATFDPPPYMAEPDPGPPPGPDVQEGPDTEPRNQE